MSCLHQIQYQQQLSLIFHQLLFLFEQQDFPPTNRQLLPVSLFYLGMVFQDINGILFLPTGIIEYPSSKYFKANSNIFISFYFLTFFYQLL